MSCDQRSVTSDFALVMATRFDSDQKTKMFHAKTLPINSRDSNSAWEMLLLHDLFTFS